MKKLSIKDIANQLGISTTTVSYILNGKAKEKRISEELNQKVLKFIKEINYKPNQLAKSLRTGKTKIICLMIEDIADQFFAKLAGHAEKVAYEHGYKIIYGSTQNDTQKSRELIDLFLDRHVDGFIITPAAGLEADILNLINEKVPFILFDRYYEDIDTNFVGIDNYQSTFNGINFLIYQKYQKIAFITLDSDQTQMSGRLQGYQQAVANHQLNEYVLKIPYDVVDNMASSIIFEFLLYRKEVEAIFFATNYLAFAGLDAINKLSLKIPEDIGVVAFDDHEVFKLYRPTITAVTQPIEEMAERLVNILLENINSPINLIEPQRFIIPAKFTVRESSAVFQVKD